jgi:hypothetical protein
MKLANRANVAPMQEESTNARESPGEDVAGVETEVQYILPTSRINRRYVSREGQINISEYRSMRIFVRDARPMAERITFDSHGFTLERHSSAVNDFTDREQIDRVYVPEMEAFVRDLTGADKVIPFAWMTRTSSPTSGEAQPPANDVHVDHTPAFSEIMAQRALTWCGEPDYPYRRFVAVNAWRAYSGAPQDWPLALCDGTSVASDEGVTYPILMVDRLPAREEIPEVLPGDPERPDFPEISAFQFRPAHRWYFYPGLGTDEVLLFKNYDSERKGPWRVPHAGFEDPKCAPTGPRLSIEVRFLVFFQ